MIRKRRERIGKVWKTEPGATGLNPSFSEAEAGGTQVQGLPELQSKPRFSLNLFLLVRPCPEVKRRRGSEVPTSPQELRKRLWLQRCWQLGEHFLQCSHWEGAHVSVDIYCAAALLPVRGSCKQA